MNKLVIRNADYVHFIYLSDIVFCRKRRLKTLFVLDNENAVMSETDFESYEVMLDNHQFVKPSPGYLVNISYIAEMRTKWPRYITLSNGKRIPLAIHLKGRIERILEGWQG